jgi:hypothetical protein
VECIDFNCVLLFGFLVNIRLPKEMPVLGTGGELCWR